jgi:hypothetical protein
VRAFIVGTGPSLNITPLEKIKDFSISVNRIHLIYPRTSWRPDAWIIADRSNTLEWMGDIQFHLNQGYPCYVRDDIPSHDLELREFWVREYPEYREFAECDHIDIDNNPPDDWHLPQLCKYGGSVPAAVQLAVLYGATEIYAVGMDMGFKPHSTSNHFDPNYAPVDALRADKAIRATKTLEHAWGLARTYCEAHDITLRNGTQGGELKALERIDLKEVL